MAFPAEAGIDSRPGSAFGTGSYGDHIESKIARFKQPRHYVIVEELPRNSMGKVQKNLLRQTYQDVFAV